MLKKIIDLIGTKRGAKKELADYLGISQNVFTSWFAQKSESYKKYAPKIAEYYGVSLDWLSGLTDEKEPKEKPATTNDDELSTLDKQFSELFPKLNDDEKRLVLAAIKGLLSNQQ